jgi:hypothetical protein
MMTFNPHTAQLSPYGIADWYRFLNLGYHLPVVGGSDKMSAAALLGGVRTYTHMGDEELTYHGWMAAVRKGNTFVTVGPLAELLVDGTPPGGRIDLAAGGGRLSVEWRVESVRLPIDTVEVIVGGEVFERIDVGGALEHAGSATVQVQHSTWIALRVRGSGRAEYQRRGEIAAHTSAVQVLVDGSAIMSKTDAFSVLQQIEGALAFVDTIAPRPDAEAYARLRADLQTAYDRLHQRMHHAGIFHQHDVTKDHH